MTEEWRDIPGWGGYYQASSEGRIRSLTRLCNSRWGLRPRKGRILSQFDTRVPGYYCVKLCGDTERSDQLVHRLVAMAFHGPCPPWASVCRHLDDNPKNNTPANLAWGTHLENSADALANGRNFQANKDECKNGHSFTPENTGLRISEKGRYCKTCDIDKARRRRDRLRNAA